MGFQLPTSTGYIAGFLLAINWLPQITSHQRTLKLQIDLLDTPGFFGVRSSGSCWVRFLGTIRSSVAIDSNPINVHWVQASKCTSATQPTSICKLQGRARWQTSEVVIQCKKMRICTWRIGEKTFFFRNCWYRIEKCLFVSEWLISYWLFGSHMMYWSQTDLEDEGRLVQSHRRS